MITISEAIMLNAALIVFSAGVLYAKVNNLEKKWDDIKDHPQRITRLETQFEDLKKQTA